MNRRLVSVGLMSLALFVWMGAQPVHAAQAGRRASGQVVKVDPAAGRFVLKTTEKGKPEELAFTAGKHAKFTRGAETVALADLRPGDKVTLTYRVELQAEHIAIAGTRPVSAAPKGGK